jgi:peptidoglycan/LPS O-acetylase OafA/YrhL
VSGWLRHLGGASYSLYLFQYVFIGVAWQGWQALRLGAVTPA